MRSIMLLRLYFNPLPPQGGRRPCQDAENQSKAFQSTPSPRRETALGTLPHIRPMISIHSLPKEGDTIHTGALKIKMQFQSTPSPRRETCLRCQPISADIISIHSLPKEGDYHFLKCLSRTKRISIHSLPKEGDASAIHHTPLPSNFNPLPPQGGRRGAA